MSKNRMESKTTQKHLGKTMGHYSNNGEPRLKSEKLASAMLNFFCDFNH